MARRCGRPRKSGARSANGRLIATTRTDPGTPQLQKKRRRLVGAGADPVLATSPLDILYARELVDADTLAAAEWFRHTARLVLGAPHPRNVLDPQRGTEPSEAAQRWAEIRYCFIAETITATRRGELLNLVHFCLVPPWLIKLVNGLPFSSRDQNDRARQMAALSDLAHVYRSWTRAGPKVAAG